GTLVCDVAEGVDVCMAVVVVVDSDEVLGETKLTKSHIRTGVLGHLELGRVRTVGPHARAERQAEADYDAAAHQACGCRVAPGGEAVDGPKLVIVPPPSPAADGLEQCGELGRRELAGLPHFPLVHAPVLAHGPTGRRPASISFLSCFLSPAESGPLLN